MGPRGVLGRRLGGASRNALGVASGNGTHAALLTRLLVKGADTPTPSACCCCCCCAAAALRFRVGILVADPGSDARRSSCALLGVTAEPAPACCSQSMGSAGTPAGRPEACCLPPLEGGRLPLLPLPVCCSVAMVAVNADAGELPAVAVLLGGGAAGVAAAAAATAPVVPGVGRAGAPRGRLGAPRAELGALTKPAMDAAAALNMVFGAGSLNPPWLLPRADTGAPLAECCCLLALYASSLALSSAASLSDGRRLLPRMAEPISRLMPILPSCTAEGQPRPMDADNRLACGV